MRLEQTRWTGSGFLPDPRLREAQLVLVFGERRRLESPTLLAHLRAAYPGARIVGTSSAGEIAGHDVGEEGVVVTAARFERTRVGLVAIDMDSVAGSYEAGAFAARALPNEGLAHVIVFADGIKVNGTELVRGLQQALPPGVAVTGGLAGDGDRFERTVVLADGPARPRTVVAVGLYGKAVRVSFGSRGGWDPHGGHRMITRAEGNVLHELDGVPALDVYRELLGDKAKGLPATGLLHPLMVTTKSGEFVRTLLGVDEKRKALIFAGDVPQGTKTYFMRAENDRLVEGAQRAAIDAQMELPGPKLALLVSCVGRRLVLEERTVEEVAAVAKVLGEDTLLSGFYSYGEICPVARGASCALHNQTMTITVIGETLEP